MCANYQLVARERRQLETLFGSLLDLDWTNPEPRKSHIREIYPGYEAPVVHHDGGLVLATYRWGFANRMPGERPLSNAKAETVQELRTFKAAFASTRCLIPANGYYEYRASDPVGKKGRYYFTLPESDLFAFAGLWEERHNIRTYTMITTEANALVRDYHNRMPVIISRRDYERWLDPNASPADLGGLLRPWDGDMAAVPAPKTVTPKVRKPAKPPPAKPNGLFD
jgi:putative SOS response-associated peptidase YedK